MGVPRTHRVFRVAVFLSSGTEWEGVALSARCKRVFIFAFEGEPSSAEIFILRTVCVRARG